MKYYIPKQEDRDAMALSLLHGGYTVRQGKGMVPGKKAAQTFVEVVENGRDQ